MTVNIASLFSLETGSRFTLGEFKSAAFLPLYAQNGKYFCTRRYLNEYHKQRSLACEKAVGEMAKHPLSYEEKMRQIKALERAEKERSW